MKTYFQSLHNRGIAILLLLSIIFYACRKETSSLLKPDETAPAQLAGFQSASKKVYVQNVDELYAAINNPANTGTTIVLAPGTYLLSANYPNAGRLELLRDMRLLGKAGDAGAVVIDVNQLPASSVVVPATPTFPFILRTGVIRMGNGYNSLEWLTVYNDPAHILRSLIQTDLMATPIAEVRIAHTIVKGANIGINIINRDAVSNGRTVLAELEDNEITNNIAEPLGAGLQIQNSQRTSNATIKVVLKRNHIHGNQWGLSAFTASAVSSNIDIKSYDDLIEGNGVGIGMEGGFSERFEFPTLDNSTRFEAHGSTIRNNSGAVPLASFYPPGLTGEIFGAAASVFPTVQPGSVNNNKLDMYFYGSYIGQPAGLPAINLYGAFSANPAGIAGTHNSTTLHLNGLSRNATVHAVPSLPAEPAGTNTVAVYR